MKKLLSLFAVLGLILLVSCEYTENPVTKANNFEGQLNSYYKTNQFLLAKAQGQDATNYCVIYNQSTGKYIAYNLINYHTGMSMEDYFNSAASSDVIDNLVPSSAGTYYSWEYKMYFEEASGAEKDLEKMGAFLQEQKIAQIGEKLSAEFGLSEERGIQIAKLSSQWGELKKRRTVTNADVHAFSKQLTGVDLNTATEAYRKSLSGDSQELNNLFEKAASVNNTTPERINKIFMRLLQ
ncbi:MAG: hypothetical protein HQK51_05840 [Oligoflexia bacterium]|nr:hypothetical protein [Oligoflexia bacterium]